MIRAVGKRERSVMGALWPVRAGSPGSIPGAPKGSRKAGEAGKQEVDRPVQMSGLKQVLPEILPDLCLKTTEGFN